MSIESYAVHIAPRGGKVDLAVDEVQAARKAALDKRWEYAKAKGASGLWHSEYSVEGLVFKDLSEVPEGWSMKQRNGDGIVAAPKPKDRTKAARLYTKAIRAELNALPVIPGAERFTKIIGSSQIITANEAGRYCMRSCWYERIGETTFVMTPWTTKADEVGNNVDAVPPTEKTRIAFHPEGCERVGLSVYYAAKEAAAAKREVAA